MYGRVKSLTTLTVLIFFICITSSVWATGSGPSPKEAWTLFDKAEVLHKQGKSKSEFLKAIDKYREALKQFERANDYRGMGRANLEIGRIRYNHLGEQDGAKELFEKALELLRRAGDIQGQAVAMNGIGLCLSRMAKDTDSIYLWEKAFALAEAAGDTEYQAKITANLASSYYKVGDYSRAIMFFERNAENLKAKGGAEYGAALTSLGVAYDKAGQKDKAMEVHQKALAVCAKANNGECQGGVLLNLGTYHYGQKEYDKAGEDYEKAESLFRQSKHQQGLFNSLRGQAMAHASAGRSEIAKKYFSYSFAILTN